MGMHINFLYAFREAYITAMTGKECKTVLRKLTLSV
jgi:hypothetical protein